MKCTNQPVTKRDAYALLSGKLVYTDDLIPADCPVIRLPRSPHAHVRIKSIDTGAARRIPDVEAIFTYKDVPASRFTLARRTYPEPSPYDRLILDEVVRCVGDEVTIIATENEASTLQVVKLIRVEYEVYDVALDFTRALDHPVIVHAEEDHKSSCGIKSERLHSLHSHDESIVGDVDQASAEYDVVLECEYHTEASTQAMMETFRPYAYMDISDRLNVVSSAQMPFHIRRMVANVLELPKSQIKVVKPRIDGGFDAKQTGCTEVFTAFVTQKLKKPCKLVCTREETLMASNSHHGMKIHVRIGVVEDGGTCVIDLCTLFSTGAHGEHGSTTVGLNGHKSLSIYNHVRASRFVSGIVYTSTMTAGACCGCGATQEQFAVESVVNELADTLHIDLCELRLKNMVQENEVMKQYYDEHLNSCTLDRCLRKVMDIIGQKEKALCRDMGDKVHDLGIALSMQGSGIANVDIAPAVIKLQGDGFYVSSIGATDAGTGCDTILMQMAAECLNCGVDNIITQSVDTDASPYDTGSYVSTTTYVIDTAVVKACEELKKQILYGAVVPLGMEEEHITFDGSMLHTVEGDKGITLAGSASRCSAGGKGACLITSASHCSPTSPPPFMARIAEMDVGKLTGEITLVDYVAIVDCRTVINPNFARIQTEGGITQGTGMAPYENITCSCKGRMRDDSFLQYRIPSWQDVDIIRADFENSYEDNGPLGAKSTGEAVINTPAPAIALAVAHANGVQIRTLPIMAEEVLLRRDGN